jgi:hypothetical protein
MTLRWSLFQIESWGNFALLFTLQGIYCPETSASRNSRKAADDAVSTAGQTFGGLVGDIANTVIRTGASIAKSATGELSVSVVSGYEFYLVKSEKR